jgi:hypothetical protein
VEAAVEEEDHHQAVVEDHRGREVEQEADDKMEGDQIREVTEDCSDKAAADHQETEEMMTQMMMMMM